MAGPDPWAALAAAKTTLANSRKLPQTLAERKSAENKATSVGYEELSQNSNSRRGVASPSQSRDFPSKDRIESNIYIYQGVSSDDTHPTKATNHPDQCDGAAPPARVAILREFKPSTSNAKEIYDLETARVISPSGFIPGPYDRLRAPTAWLDGCAIFTPHEPPCLGFSRGEWARVLPVINLFMEQHAHIAHDLGWTTLDLFGVHPVVGAARVDCCGALMVSSGEPVHAVEPDAIVFRRTTFRRRRIIPDAVPIWAFVVASRTHAGRQVAKRDDLLNGGRQA